jgi:hypothetical protein
MYYLGTVEVERWHAAIATICAARLVAERRRIYVRLPEPRPTAMQLAV